MTDNFYTFSQAEEIKIAVPFAVFGLAALIPSVLLCSRAHDHVPASLQGDEGGRRLTLFRHAKYQQLRRALFNQATAVFISSALVAISVWAVPWCAAMYLACLFAAHGAWEVQHAAKVEDFSSNNARMSSLSAVCTSVRFRLTWTRPLIVVHVGLGIVQVRNLLLPLYFSWCYVPHPGPCSTAGFYIQPAFGILSIVAMFALMLSLTLLLGTVQYMELTYHQMLTVFNEVVDAEQQQQNLPVAVVVFAEPEEETAATAPK